MLAVVLVHHSGNVGRVRVLDGLLEQYCHSLHVVNGLLSDCVIELVVFGSLLGLKCFVGSIHVLDGLVAQFAHGLQSVNDVLSGCTSGLYVIDFVLFLSLKCLIQEVLFKGHTGGYHRGSVCWCPVDIIAIAVLVHYVLSTCVCWGEVRFVLAAFYGGRLLDGDGFFQLMLVHGVDSCLCL